MKQSLKTQKSSGVTLKSGQNFNPESTHASSKSHLPPTGSRKQTLKDDPRVMEASHAPLKLPMMQHTISASGSVMQQTQHRLKDVMKPRKGSSQRRDIEKYASRS